MVAGMLAAAVILVGFFAAPTTATAADCSGGPSDRSDAITEIKLTEASGDPIGNVQAWQSVNVQFKGEFPDGACSGDTVTVELPSQLDYPSGSFEVRSPAPENTLMGSMVVSNGRAVFTFNEYVETHKDITFNGWLESTVNNTMEPGKDYELEFKVPGKAIRVPVTTGPCPENCDQLPTWASKWANLEVDDQGNEYVAFGIVSKATQAPGEWVVFNDVLGPGQKFDCSTGGENIGLYSRVATEIDAWGNLIFDDYRHVEPYSAAGAAWCTDTELKVQAQGQHAGEYLMVGGRILVTDKSLKEYTDDANVFQGGKSEDVNAQAKRRSGGAGGDGKTEGTFSVKKAVDLNGAPQFDTGTFTGTWTATLPDKSTQNGNWSVKAGETWQGPTLPTGTTVQLTENTNGDQWTASWSSSNITIAGGEDTQATVTNKLKVGSVEVKKIVDWNGFTPWDIEFTGTWKATLGDTEVGSGTWKVNKDNDWRWVGPTLPAGAVVSLTEDSTPGWTSSWNDEQVITVPDGHKTCPEVTNTLQVGEFEIAKSIDWGDVEQYEAGPFTGTWSAVLGEGDARIEVGSGTWSVEAGESWTSPALPAGARVSYTEDAPAGGDAVRWTNAWSSEDLTIEPGGTASVDLTNTAELLTGVFSASKTIEGDGADLVPAASEFTLKYRYPAGTGYAAGEGELLLKADGTSVTSGRLPLGAVLTLEELEPVAVQGGTWREPKLSTDTVTIGEGDDEVHVTVTNTITKTPETPEKPEKPEKPETPEAPKKPELPGTGSALPFGLAAGGALLVLAGGLLLARRQRL